MIVLGNFVGSSRWYKIKFRDISISFPIIGIDTVINDINFINSYCSIIIISPSFFCFPRINHKVLLSFYRNLFRLGRTLQQLQDSSIFYLIAKKTINFNFITITKMILLICISVLQKENYSKELRNITYWDFLLL